MKYIRREDLKTGDRIIIPAIGDEPEHSAEVDDVEDGMVFVEVWGNDRDDDNWREYEISDLPESLEIWG